MNDYKELIGELKELLYLNDENLQSLIVENNDLQNALVDALDAIEQLVKERDAAIDCIYAIEDALDRGNDNDWAREHIDEWRGVQEDNNETN